VDVADPIIAPGRNACHRAPDPAGARRGAGRTTPGYHLANTPRGLGGEGVADFLWIGLGGFLGANARYALGLWVVDRSGAGFPLHTLVINVTGSLAIGVLLVLLTERLVVDPAWRLLLVVGFLGGYTTFSSYTFEALVLAEEGEWTAAAGYVLGSNGLGLAAAYLGAVLARAIGR
jgi:CrcB protein